MHRPYPPPPGRGPLCMRWHDLLFAHWPVDPAALRPFIPPPLDLDLLDGRAWLGIVPFRMTGVRHRWLPPFPGHSAFPELNVRTYVRAADGRPGVWFFSLDAASALAVRTARLTFSLPYMNARMSCLKRAGAIEYASLRTGPHTALAYGVARTPDARLEAEYEPAGDPLPFRAGSIEDFLTSRYCLYAWRRRCLLRAEIDHPPWPLRPARASITVNTMAAQLGLETPDPAQALLHYADVLEVCAWLPARVG